MAEKTVIIATRGSKLALWQAEWVRSQILRLNPSLKIELLKIKTTGDKILDVPLAKVGGKGLFVKEIEEAILRQEAHLAVHSMKDVPTELPEGLHIRAILKREDPRDVLISRYNLTFESLPKGASLGTSSLRRACQLLSIRPDLKIITLRGNLDTRIRKLNEGKLDALILAGAGVKRLGFEDKITEFLAPEISLPAIGQGAIGIECKTDDTFINNLVNPLNHEDTSICVGAERASLRRLEGGCQVPIAAHARLIGRRLHIDGLVGSVSGRKIIKSFIEGRPEDAETLGIRLAEGLLSKGAREILAEVYGSSKKFL